MLFAQNVKAGADLFMHWHDAAKTQVVSQTENFFWKIMKY